MKKTINVKLSTKSLKEAQKSISEYKKKLNESISTGTKKSGELLFNKVLENCDNVGIVNSKSSIKFEFDEKNNRARIYSNNKVIVFNEFGTGIIGKNFKHPNYDKYNYRYDVNNHGVEGWNYPKEDGTFGHTRGLPSRRMFYNALQDVKKDFKNTVIKEINVKIPKGK